MVFVFLPTPPSLPLAPFDDYYAFIIILQTHFESALEFLNGLLLSNMFHSGAEQKGRRFNGRGKEKERRAEPLS